MRNQGGKRAGCESGLCLGQEEDGGESAIQAERVRPGSIALQQGIVFRYAEGDRFRDRIDAREAQLEPGRWVLFDAWLSHPGESPLFHDRFELPTDLTVDKIQESFAPPETRSEERRVGNECVSRCRSRCSPYH